MWLERVRRYLLPGGIERDEGFHQEILRQSYIGLQVVGGIQIAVALFMTVARFLVAPDPETAPLRLWEAGIVIVLGLISIGLARIKPLYPYTRIVAIGSGLVIASVLIWFALLLSQYDPSADDFVPGQITLVLLVGVAAIPLRPTDTLALGFLVESVYVILSLTAQEMFLIGSGAEAVYVMFIFMLTLLATGLTTVLYHQRVVNYQGYLHMLRAAEDLRKSEARNLLSQNAASVGRLAAALSHEINSPIGALVSGVDTLLLLTSKQATSTAPEQQRLVVLQSDLRKSIKESTDRLRELVTRMQRFTNLDRADVQAANLNEILGDVAALLEPRFRSKAKLELDLKPLPQLVCKPQQLSAVFSNLLGNAIEALNGNGRVKISSRQKDAGNVEVEIEDNGRGLDPTEMETIFDPGFKVARGRVSTGNWSMFSSRQIVREHGGDIFIFSRPGEGTKVSVMLPVAPDGSTSALT